ncbi:unnamed protein product, partial [Closterium sp. NIES-53]
RRASAQPLAPCLLAGDLAHTFSGKVGDASRFRVWGARAFVRDTTADKLSARTVPCVFLGFVPDAPGWQFYNPTLRRVFPSQDVTFDDSVPFYCLFPYRTAPLPPPPLFLTPGAPQVDPLPAPGPAPSGVSQVDPPPLTAPVEVTGDSGPAEGGPARGAASGGAEPGGAEPGGAERGDAEPGREESRGAEPGGTESRGAVPGGAEASGAPQVDPLPAPGPAPSGVSQVDPPPLTAPVEVTGDSGPAEGGPARGAASGGAEPGGAEPGGAERGDAEPGREESRGAEPGGTESRGAVPGGAEASGEQSPWSGRLRSRSAGTSPLPSRRRLPLSPQRLREWYVGHQGRTAGARGPAAGGAGAGDSATGVVSSGGSGAAKGAGARGCTAAEGASAGGSGVAAGTGTEGSEFALARSPWISRLRSPWGSAAGGISADVTGARSGAGPGGARTGGTGAAGAGGSDLEGAAAGDTEAGDPGTGGADSGGAAAGGAGPGGAGAEGSGAAGGAGTAGGAGAAGAGSTAQPRLFFAPLSPSSQPPSDSVLRQVLRGLIERREPASRPVSPVRSGRSGRHLPCSCQPAVLGTHLVVRRPSSPPQSVPLPSPPASSLPTIPEPESEIARAAHPTFRDPSWLGTVWHCSTSLYLGSWGL